MARGDDALLVSADIAGLGRAVDGLIGSDPLAARSVAERELAEILAYEARTGRRVHKGHALHNIGVVIAPQEPLAARVYFHAAFVEDVRTYPDRQPEGLGLARTTLVESYQERLSALEDLAGQARDTLTDPLELAAAFEEEQGEDLGLYVGLRSGWRDESDIADFGPEQLVFVAGWHGLPHHMKALRDAVTAVGLEPVVVMEFRDLEGEDEASKSERLMRLCGRAVFDVSLDGGWSVELAWAEGRMPFFAGYVVGSVSGARHGSGMIRGLFARSKVTPEAVVDTAQLAEAARAWLKKGNRARFDDRHLLRPKPHMVGAGGSATSYDPLMGPSFEPVRPPGMDFPIGASGVPYLVEVEDNAALDATWGSKKPSPAKPGEPDAARRHEPSE